jgi:hypothetical protein
MSRQQREEQEQAEIELEQREEERIEVRNLDRSVTALGAEIWMVRRDISSCTSAIARINERLTTINAILEP